MAPVRPLLTTTTTPLPFRRACPLASETTSRDGGGRHWRTAATSPSSDFAEMGSVQSTIYVDQQSEDIYLEDMETLEFPMASWAVVAVATPPTPAVAPETDLLAQRIPSLRVAESAAAVGVAVK